MNQPILKTSEIPWPKDKCFYLLAKDGLYKGRNHMFFRSCVKVHSATFDGLVPQDEFCTVRYPKMPCKMMEDIWAFFEETAKRHGAEAIVLPCYDFDAQQIVPWVPKQESSGMHVTYKGPEDLPDNLIIIGSIHSHVDAGAFHSGTDISDEKEKDGLHITLGKVRGKFPEISAQVVIDEVRFTIKPEHVIEGFFNPSPKIPDGWLDQFTYKPWRYEGGYGGEEWHDWNSEMSIKANKKKKWRLFGCE